MTEEKGLSDEVAYLKAQNHELKRQLRELNASRALLGQLLEQDAVVTHLARQINTLDQEIITRVATCSLPELIGAERAYLFLFRYRTDKLILVAKGPVPEEDMEDSRHPDIWDGPGLPDTQLDLDPETLVGHTVSLERILLISDVGRYEEERGRPFTPTYVDEDAAEGGIIIAPLKAAGRLVGVLVLVGKEGGESFDEINDLAVVERLGLLLGISIRNTQLYREVREQARTDGLTRLANHKTFYEEVEREVSRTGRYGRPLSLLMMDLNDFKMVNDKYGHRAGDRILKVTGEILQNEIRNQDIPARYGGDEFAIIMPETGVEGAQTVVERIESIFETMEVEFEGRTYGISASIGVVEYVKGQTPSEFVEAADKRLFEAKREVKGAAASH